MTWLDLTLILITSTRLVGEVRTCRLPPLAPAWSPFIKSEDRYSTVEMEGRNTEKQSVELTHPSILTSALGPLIFLSRSASLSK
jgi:hypothetical protein